MSFSQEQSVGQFYNLEMSMLTHTRGCTLRLPVSGSRAQRPVSHHCRSAARQACSACWPSLWKCSDSSSSSPPLLPREPRVWRRGPGAGGGGQRQPPCGLRKVHWRVHGWGRQKRRDNSQLVTHKKLRGEFMLNGKSVWSGVKSSEQV